MVSATSDLRTPSPISPVGYTQCAYIQERMARVTWPGWLITCRGELTGLTDRGHSTRSFLKHNVWKNSKKKKNFIKPHQHITLWQVARKDKWKQTVQRSVACIVALLSRNVSDMTYNVLLVAPNPAHSPTGTTTTRLRFNRTRSQWEFRALYWEPHFLADVTTS